MIENFDIKDTLFSYLSLTETNQARDFEKLFAERWAETLSERYPKLPVFQFLPFMDAILRDTGTEWLKPLLYCDRGLIGTRSKRHDKNAEVECPKEVLEVLPDTARLFGNIDELRETRWIFVFDEVDRAEFDEIFRMIEIIERFKYLGRTGLPVQMIFVLCISDEDLQGRLDMYEKSETKTVLIRDFLFSNPKNITYKLMLPIPDPQLRMEFVKKKIELTAQNLHKEVSIDLKKMSKMFYELSDPFITWPDDPNVAMLYAVRILADESPRMVNRTLSAVKITLRALEQNTGRLFQVRFADIILMEYTKIRHPILWKFFEKLLLSSFAGFYGVWKAQKEFNQLMENEEKDANRLYAWIKSETGKDIEEQDKSIVRQLVGVVGHFCVDEMKKTPHESHAREYFGSLSLKETMKRYIDFRPNDPANSLESSILWLNDHKQKQLKLQQLKSQDILDYSGYLRDFGVDNVEILWDVFKEIKQHLVDGIFKFKSNAGIESQIDAAVYHFKSKMVRLIELNYTIDKIWKESVELLKAQNVSTYGKFQFVRALLMAEEPRDQMAISKLHEEHKDELLIAIESVFNEANNRYLESTAKEDLYAKEENFQYVLWQSWSGKNDTAELGRIREAAKRNLTKHSDILRQYWEPYTTKPGPIIGDSINSAQVYMPFEALVNITQSSSLAVDAEIQAQINLWQQNKQDSKYNNIFNITESSNTLKAVFEKLKH